MRSDRDSIMKGIVEQSIYKKHKNIEDLNKSIEDLNQKFSLCKSKILENESKIKSLKYFLFTKWDKILKIL